MASDIRTYLWLDVMWEAVISKGLRIWEERKIIKHNLRN